MHTMTSLGVGSHLNKGDTVFLLSIFNSLGSNKIEGRTRLQKMVYILKEKEKIPFSFKYKPYFYGPYSEELYETIQDLVALNLLKEEIEPKGNGVYQYDYVLTEPGKQYAEKISKLLEKETPEIEEKIKKKTRKYIEKPLSEVINEAKSI